MGEERAAATLSTGNGVKVEKHISLHLPYTSLHLATSRYISLVNDLEIRELDKD